MLFATPILYLSVSKIPMGVSKRLEGLLTRFSGAVLGGRRLRYVGYVGHGL